MSENNIKIFTNDNFGTVRTIQKDDKVLFCGADVAKALGYADTSKAIKSHCKKDGWVIYPVIDKLGRTQQARFIDEGNTYRLITHSKLPTAEKFEKWVFDEVLPTIRKTGGYVSNEDLFINTYLPYADDNTKTLFRTALSTITQLNHKIEQDKPLVDFASHIQTSDDCISMNDMAKIAAKNGIKIGRNRLFDFLRKQKILDDKNIPYQRYIESQPWFQVKESIVMMYGKPEITMTTNVTPKGQIGIIKKLKKNYV